MTSRGHALSREALIRTLTAYSGITTEDGAAGGGTLIDSNLIDNAFISPSGIPEKTILILTGNARGEDKGAASFNNGTGAITLQGTGFSDTILAGTIYRILNISSIEIDVANIQEDLGDMADTATADDLSDITTTSALAKLRRLLLRFSAGPFSASIDGVARTTLDAVYTALGVLLGTRATAAATGAVSSTKALMAYIKQIVTVALDIQTIVTVLGVGITAIYDIVAHGTYGLQKIMTHQTGTIILNATYGLTALGVRITAILTIVAHGTYGLEKIMAHQTGTIILNATYGLTALGVRITAIQTIVAHASYGLSAIKTYLTGTVIGNATYGLTALGVRITAIQTIVSHASYGLSAIKTYLTGTVIGNATYGLTALGVRITTIQDIVAHGTYGLQKIMTHQTGTIILNATYGLTALGVRITAIQTIVSHASYGLSAIKTYLTGTVIQNATYGLTALGVKITSIYDIVAHGTYGLAALKALIDTVDTVVDAIKVTTDRIEGATGIFHEQADVALNVSVDNSENDLFDLSAASTRFIVRSLRVKCADPGAGETVTIRLYELINDGATLIDSFIIDHDNYMTYFSLMDMFGVPHLAGDDLHVVAIGSVAGPVALTGQYSHAKSNN